MRGGGGREGGAASSRLALVSLLDLALCLLRSSTGWLPSPIRHHRPPRARPRPTSRPPSSAASSRDLTSSASSTRASGQTAAPSTRNPGPQTAGGTRAQTPVSPRPLPPSPPRLHQLDRGEGCARLERRSATATSSLQPCSTAPVTTQAPTSATECARSRRLLALAGSVSTAPSSALVRLGKTSVVCGITLEIAAPDLTRPNEGFIGASPPLAPSSPRAAH